jgi:hypothetical protein
MRFSTASNRSPQRQRPGRVTTIVCVALALFVAFAIWRTARQKPAPDAPVTETVKERPGSTIPPQAPPEQGGALIDTGGPLDDSVAATYEMLVELGAPVPCKIAYRQSTGMSRRIRIELTGSGVLEVQPPRPGDDAGLQVWEGSRPAETVFVPSYPRPGVIRFTIRPARKGEHPNLVQPRTDIVIIP